MTVLTLQQLSISMEDGKVLRWLVADGSRVEEGDVLVEVETDKATIEVEAPAGGILRIVAGEGSIVPVDGVLGELQVSAEHDGEGDRAFEPELPVTTDGPATERAAPAAESGRPSASPAARRLAERLGLDLTGVHGTGPGGRIVVRDLGVAPPMPAGRPGEEAPRDDRLREAVVRSIVASWQQIPHVQIGGELAADGLVAAHAALRPTDAQVTVTDLLAFALARALAEVPELNATLGPDGTVTRSGAVHLSLAVATPRGVVAPVLRDAGSLTLASSQPSARASSPPPGPASSTGACSPAERSRSRTSATCLSTSSRRSSPGLRWRWSRPVASPRSRSRRRAGSPFGPACGRTSRSTTAPPTARPAGGCSRRSPRRSPRSGSSHP